ncbi:MAG TPA: HNH endonuclease signature motif containing protein [Allosphingosinicella sp.]|jgi:hypothetical protein
MIPSAHPESLSHAIAGSLDPIGRRKRALENAVERTRSAPWQLRLWGRLVKTRDRHRCVNCEETTGIQAHHIIRKIRLPAGALDPGNGITLCRDCHRLIHAEFNRKPDPNRPLSAAQGDDQNEWAFLFGRLVDDAGARGLAHDEFYYVSNETLRFAVAYQGYEEILEAIEDGTMSRLRVMHEIWRWMPGQFYTNLAEDICERLLMR